MALQPFTKEQLNYFKLAFIVVKEFPKALRQTFKYMWDNFIGSRPHGYKMWDDSIAVRNVLLTLEGGKTKIPTHLSYDEWDCTALFQATIYAQSFALPHSKGGHAVLSDLYIKPLRLPYGNFHASVLSPGGNKAETFALAIDQLRLLRNSLLHSATLEIDKVTFDQYVQLSKDAFKALGLKTDDIDAVESLTELDFPTELVQKLEREIKKELQTDKTFLREEVKEVQEEVKEELCCIKDEVLGLRSDIARLQWSEDEREKATTNSTKEVKENIAELMEKFDNIFKRQRPGMNPSLKGPSLPPMVPHFTGRKRECDDIISQVTSESTRIVSVWGSPGFGKTSVAVAVGHHLQSIGFPVCFLSLRGLKSKSDLTSKFLGVLRQLLPFSNDQPPQQLSLDDELCQIVSKISDSLVCILDNADDLLETGAPNVKDEVIDLLEEILRSNDKVTLLVTSRESFEFMNMRFEGHQTCRIRQLDGHFSQELVHKLLPAVGSSDCKKITKICGDVPLAIKLLCSSISEDNPIQLSQVLEDYLEASDDVVQMLDNPDYPSNQRLQVLFGTSFQRLSEEEKKALVSLTILPENFDLEVAAAVLGIATTTKANKILKRLRRKSLLDLASKTGSFSIHKLLHSFSREKGEQEMKETIISAKARFRAHYIALFKTLNEKFLAGHSMSPFTEFYDVKPSIIQSLIEGCSDANVADDAFEVLATAEHFLDLLLWREGNTFNKIYDSALEESCKQGRKSSYRKLLVSKAFAEITWGKDGKTLRLLNEAKECQALPFSVPNDEQGKLLCYLGTYQLVVDEVESGIQCLHEALSLMGNIPALAIPKLITYQILAVYYHCRSNPASASYFQRKAIQECPAGSPHFVVIPSVSSEPKNQEKEASRGDHSNQPLLFQVLYCVSKATAHFSDLDTQQFFGNVALKILDSCIASFETSLGLFSFRRIVVFMLRDLAKYEEAVKVAESVITSHQTALEECKNNDSSFSKENKQAQSVTSSELHEEALVKCYLDLGEIHYGKGNYSAALQSQQLAVDLALAVFGQEHLLTAKCYYVLGWTQFQLGDYTSSLQYAQLALKIRRKQLGEDHSLTAYSYRSVGFTQHELGDYHSALQSKQRGLNIRLKLFGEEDPQTADSYRSVGFTQDEIGDYNSALQSKQHELAIRLKVFGEEHPKTAESYRSMGYTQHQLGDYNSALQSKQRELCIRLKVHGEEHSKTADSYHSVGVTQRELGNYHSACQSYQHALNVRLKLFGEENSQTAESYHELGVTQRQLGQFTPAIQSMQHALNIRLKILGEEHSKTADSYHELGVTQHQLGDDASACQSFQHAFNIRLKLFGEVHAETSKSYHLLGVTQKFTR